jgi:ketosteroid isomerase-like protein
VPKLHVRYIFDTCGDHHRIPRLICLITERSLARKTTRPYWCAKSVGATVAIYEDGPGKEEPMLRILALVLISLGAVVADGQAQAAEQQVEEAVLAFYQNLADQNAAAWNSMVAPDGVGNFPRTGAALATPNGGDPAGMQAAFDSGQLSYQLAVEDLSVSVYGNTAVATCYTTGPSNVGGNEILGTFRVSQVWVRQGQPWQAVHWHISPLVS